MKTLLSILILSQLTFLHADNYSLNFDGVDDYVALPTLNDAGSIGTISAWASFNSVSFAEAHTGIYSVGNSPLNGSSVSLLGVHAGVNNNLRFGFYTNTWYWVDSGIYPSVDTWYNVVGTWGSDGLKIYVNGELKATNGSYTGGIPSDDNHYIGSGNSANSVIDGKIDEVSIWSTALSLEQIQSYMSTQLTGNESGLVGYWNFNTGSGTTLTDQTSNGNDGTIYGATWSTDVPPVYPPPPLIIPTIVINEFLASNDACCTDENGEYEDYIEVYNYGNEAVDIGGLFITDEIGSYDDYYQIPAGNDSTIIQPGSFLLLWADKESEQGVLHVEIKLSNDGEQIGLFMPDSTTVVDTLTFGEQSDDVSYGRYPDGSDTWQLMNPTPGITNTQELRSNVDLIIPSQYTVHQNYPNPFNPITTLRYDLPENGHVNIIIYDMLGRHIKTLINQTQDAGYKSVIWNATNDYGKPVSAGIYLYQIQAGEYISTKKMVLLK